MKCLKRSIMWLLSQPPIRGQDVRLELITAYFEHKVGAKTFINNLMHCIEKQGAITLDDVYESANVIQVFPHNYEWKHPISFKKEKLVEGELLPRCYFVSLPLIECKEKDQNE